MGLQYIPPERLFWDQAPAVPLMTSSISWGLLEHDYGDLQFIHICCCVDFLCTRFSCSELCDLLLWASGTANSQQWHNKDNIKILFGAVERSSNHIQNLPCRPPICTVHIHKYSVLDYYYYYIIEAHITSVTVNELHYSRAVNVNYRNSIKYIESDRCHMCPPPMNQQPTLYNMMKVDSSECKTIILAPK